MNRRMREIDVCFCRTQKGSGPVLRVLLPKTQLGQAGSKVTGHVSPTPLLRVSASISLTPGEICLTGIGKEEPEMY